jgi:exosortase
MRQLGSPGKHTSPLERRDRVLFERFAPLRVVLSFGVPLMLSFGQSWVPQSARHAWFAALCLTIAGMSWTAVGALSTLAVNDDRYTYILVVPAICITMLYANRRRIFAVSRSTARAGIPLLIGTAAIMMAPNTALAGHILALVLTCAAAFVLCYGIPAFRQALFPLALLLLVVPPPESVFSGISRVLQTASADFTHFLFTVLGVPVFREGLEFSLRNVRIEIAEECSGIRSSIALLISGSVAAYFFLESAWSRLTLLLILVPALIVKNAVRIVTLSCLASYVDPGFLHGSLHHRFGSVFALVALALVLPSLLLLQRLERKLRSHRLQLTSGSQPAASMPHAL